MPNLAVVEQWANLIGAAASFVAAGLWWWASLTPIPAFPDVGLGSYSSVFEPVRGALQTASRRNAWAASISSLAALAFGVAFLGHGLIPASPSGP
jgi:hypothetical protein